MEIPIKRWSGDARLPERAHPDDAGFDCFIRSFRVPRVVNGEKRLEDWDGDTYELKPMERVGCALGFATAIPEGYFAMVVPRSGYALWYGLSIVNSPGIIDAGYRNEWMAIVINLSEKPVILRKGDRICQMIIRKIENVEFHEYDILPSSERGLGGFGSTGT